jgi:2-methylisocitrate lyase-like PEP mutase family enzyme
MIEEPERFARKLAVAKNAQRTDEFVVIARLESLIVGESVAEAVERARLYRIHADGSSAAAEGSIAPVSALFELTGTDDLMEDESALRRG